MQYIKHHVPNLPTSTLLMSPSRPPAFCSCSNAQFRQRRFQRHKRFFARPGMRARVFSLTGTRLPSTVPTISFFNRQLSTIQAGFSAQLLAGFLSFFLSRNLCQDSAYRTQDTCVTCHALSNRYSTVHIKTMTKHQNYLLYRTAVHVSKIPLSWILLLYRYFQLSSLKPSKPI